MGSIQKNIFGGETLLVIEAVSRQGEKVRRIAGNEVEKASALKDFQTHHCQNVRISKFEF